MAHKKKELEITGSLLQDVTLPKSGDLEEGTVELFLGGDFPTPPAVDAQEIEVNKFLSGGK